MQGRGDESAGAPWRWTGRRLTDAKLVAKGSSDAEQAKPPDSGLSPPCHPMPRAALHQGTHHKPDPQPRGSVAAPSCVWTGVPRARGQGNCPKAPSAQPPRTAPPGTAQVHPPHHTVAHRHTDEPEMSPQAAQPWKRRHGAPGALVSPPGSDPCTGRPRSRPRGCGGRTPATCCHEGAPPQVAPALAPLAGLRRRLTRASVSPCRAPCGGCCAVTGGGAWQPGPGEGPAT